MKNKILSTAIAVIVVVIAVTVLSAYFFLPAGTKKTYSEYRIIIASGATLKTAARDLKQNGIIRSARFFYLYGRMRRVFLKAGIYKVSSGMSVAEICTVLESGKQEYIGVSLSEGLTLSKIAAVLEKHSVCTADSFMAAARSRSLLDEFGIPADSFEGYLFPDTYNFDYGMPAEKVVRVLVKNFFSKIQKLPALSGKTPEDLHEIVILASIVEREYRLTEEAPLIASVFTNRLKKNIGLYSCATLVYILTEIEGRPHPEVIKLEDTKINNPYNTYKWAGLPPAPISNPGLTALEAAAAPPVTPYYYFRLIDSTKGNHVFTENFDSHKEAAPVPTKRAAGAAASKQNQKAPL